MTFQSKKAWRLQEFAAHGGNVNCLSIGKKTGRVMVTGGEDRKVNFWTIGSPVTMSLSGHNAPVDCVNFDDDEEHIVAGSSSGIIKLWSIEKAQLVRTLSGHKANISALGFHPFSHFLASGSMDTNVRIWDTRRQGCIFTYKGQGGRINCLKFSPDGKWVVTGSEDGTTKIWDLASSKVLHEFKLHQGSVTALDFHPCECLLASASADKTVRFWDLETFELVSVSSNEAKPIRDIIFSPEGNVLLSGAEDSLRVYGWEPSRTLDSLCMFWGKIYDMKIAHNQLIGGSFHHTNVSVWVVDLSKIKPFNGDINPIDEADVPASEHASSVAQPAVTSKVDVTSKELYPVNEAAPRKQSPKERVQSGGAKRTPPLAKRNISCEPKTEVPAHPVSRTPPPARAPRQNPSTPPKVTRSPPQVRRSPPQVRKSSPRTLKNEPEVKQKTPPQVRRSPPLQHWENKNQEENVRAMDKLDLADPKPEVVSITEQGCIKSLMSGHRGVRDNLETRLRNLQYVRSVWNKGDLKRALEVAIDLDDLGVTVDMLQVMQCRPADWDLQICTVALPAIRNLFHSKHENYLFVGCSALKHIIKSFGQLIRDNMNAPPVGNIDISREERYKKCHLCYQQITNISREVTRHATAQGKLGSAIREIIKLSESFY